jgi:hypothetical protein
MGPIASDGARSAFRVLNWFRRRWSQLPVASTADPVFAWKQSWAVGARARWAGSPASANPHERGSREGEAWAAGWRWAEQQPDRRASVHVRLAHPHRRGTDHPSALLQSARTAGIGVSTLVVATWLWRIRTRQRSRRRGHSHV